MVGNRHPCLFKETDVTRAFKAARAAGVTARIDIGKDGVIHIVPLAPQEAVEAPKPSPNGTPAADADEPLDWD
jgi:hypothetical protein